MGATTFLGAWNNILSLVDKLFENKVKTEIDVARRDTSSRPDGPVQFTESPVRVSVSPTYTCFISHSHEDEEFTAKLSSDLKSHGIKVWRFAEDAKWGGVVWGEITDNIQANDKLIVICSEKSLQSRQVLREIERALGREDSEDKNILFPIRIDDYIFAKDAMGNDQWQHPRKNDVIAKVVGDFRDWDKDASKYANAFDKLLKGLQA